jgi:hypothetical protein
MTSILCIPDSHAKPNVNNNRYEWLAHLALDRRPDVIVDMGDWADMPSLCSYDMGKKSFEGRRYAKDVASARDARERFAYPISEHNRKSIAGDNTIEYYHPRLVALGGNHDEGRINRVIELHPELDGTISHHDLIAKAYGWEYVPFLKPISIHGITFCHYFPSGVMSYPISGENPAGSILKKMFMSTISAHTHLRDFAERTRADGRKICSAVVGCYFEHNEAYTKGTDSMWWRGVMFANNIQDGQFDPEFINIKTLRKTYG